jgi:hypothetical protein
MTVSRDDFGLRGFPVALLGACQSIRTEQSDGHFVQAHSEILSQYREYSVGMSYLHGQ